MDPEIMEGRILGHCLKCKLHSFQRSTDPSLRSTLVGRTQEQKVVGCALCIKLQQPSQRVVEARKWSHLHTKPNDTS